MHMSGSGNLAAVEISRVHKSFVSGIPVLNNINLRVGRGEMVALIGASGSGKSTLIRTIAGLTPIDRGPAGDGMIRIFGQPIQSQGRVTSAAGTLRARVGVVFQQFNLVSRLSVLTNVLLGLLGQVPRWRGSLGQFTHEEKQRAMRALQRVGIERHALKRGSELSGGQQQRAAIARTLLQGADVLIADEPIASLDPSSARRVMDILSDLNEHEGITVLVSLHQVEYALRYCPRTIALRNGEVVYDGPSERLTPKFLGELYGAESQELFLPTLQEEIDDAVVLGRDKHAANGGARVPAGVLAQKVNQTNIEAAGAA
ncbi:MAG TPA: phosphonate ABC transporter ATP-binding protein [Pseudorhodoplanes sp.]|nr:phosphonate ABC transporter ATP-binding protein [Pseudorhodoplanes sp.]